MQLCKSEGSVAVNSSSTSTVTVGNFSRGKTLLEKSSAIHHIKYFFRELAIRPDVSHFVKRKGVKLSWNRTRAFNNQNIQQPPTTKTAGDCREDSGISMLYNRREHWAEGGLSGDKFGQSFDLHLGSHGISSYDVTTGNGHLFEEAQGNWSPAFSLPSQPTSPFADWTPSTSTSDLSDQQFPVSPTFSNHWELTFTGKISFIQFTFDEKSI